MNSNLLHSLILNIIFQYIKVVFGEVKVFHLLATSLGDALTFKI